MKGIVVLLRSLQVLQHTARSHPRITAILSLGQQQTINFGHIYNTVCPCHQYLSCPSPAGLVSPVHVARPGRVASPIRSLRTSGFVDKAFQVDGTQTSTSAHPPAASYFALAICTTTDLSHHDGPRKVDRWSKKTDYPSAMTVLVTVSPWPLFHQLTSPPIPLCPVVCGPPLQRSHPCGA